MSCLHLGSKETEPNSLCSVSYTDSVVIQATFTFTFEPNFFGFRAESCNCESVHGRPKLKTKINFSFNMKLTLFRSSFCRFLTLTAANPFPGLVCVV